MAKIGTYPAASALGGTEELIAVQSAASVKITPDQFKAYIASGAYKTGAYTAVAGDTVLVASDTDTITITLPATPTTNDKVSVWDAGDNAGSNTITCARNGNTINGVAEDFLVNMDGGRVDFVYDGTNSTWRYSYVIQTVQPSQTVTFKRTVELPAGVWATNAQVPESTIGGANRVDGRAYSAGVYEATFTHLSIPNDWDGNALEFRILWSPHTSTNTGTVRWTLYGGIASGADTEYSTGPYGTAISSGPGVAHAGKDTGWTSINSIGGAAAGDIVNLQLMRAGPEVDDTFTADAHMVLVELRFTCTFTLNAATALASTTSAVYNTQTGTTYTIQATDNGKIINFTNAAAVAVTLPDGLPEGFQCTILQSGAGTPTVTPSGSDTVNGAGAGVAPSAQWSALYLTKFSATEWAAVS